MSRRFRVCLVVWIAVIALSVMTGRVYAQAIEVVPRNGDEQSLIPVPRVSDAEWVMEIIPARKVLTTTALRTAAVPIADTSGTAVDAGAEETVVKPCGDCGKTQVNAADYVRIYDQIPFNRAEYNGNPTYRHDSAMELLTGNARHQTIVRHGPSPRPRTAAAQPATAQPSYPYFPYGYIRPAVRFNYYRHFPSLRPFWNMSWYGYSGIF